MVIDFTQVWSRVSLTKKLGGLFCQQICSNQWCYFAAQDGEGALVAFI